MQCALILLLVLGLLNLSVGSTWGVSLRCGGRLVSVGDYQNDVVRKCGEPNDIEYEEAYPDAWISQLYDYERKRFRAPHLIRGPIVRQTWIYNFGPNRLIHFLHFESGKLIRITTGDRGHVLP